MRPIRKLSLARVTTAWGVLLAIVHTYWGAAGAAGMDGDDPVGAGRLSLGPRVRP